MCGVTEAVGADDWDLGAAGGAADVGVGAEVEGVHLHGEGWDGVEDVEEGVGAVVREPEAEQEAGRWHVEGEGFGGVGVHGHAQAPAGGAQVEAQAGYLE